MWKAKDLECSTELYDQGKKLFRDGDYERAASLLERSSKLYPHFKTLELLGSCYIELERQSEAIIALAAATTLNRGLRPPLILAEYLLTKKDLHSAKDIAQIVLQRSPGHKRAQAILEIPD